MTEKTSMNRKVELALRKEADRLGLTAPGHDWPGTSVFECLAAAAIKEYEKVNK